MNAPPEGDRIAPSTMGWSAACGASGDVRWVGRVVADSAWEPVWIFVVSGLDMVPQAGYGVLEEIAGLCVRLAAPLLRVEELWARLATSPGSSSYPPGAEGSAKPVLRSLWQVLGWDPAFGTDDENSYNDFWSTPLDSSQRVAGLGCTTYQSRVPILDNLLRPSTFTWR
jgi:hypothetical protein